MKPSLVLLSAVLVLFCLPWLAFSIDENTEASYTTGKLLDIEKRVKAVPRMWVWNTVVTQTETVSYRLRVDGGVKMLTTEYVPDIQPDGPLPVEWRPGAPITFRTEKNTIYIRLSYGREIETHIVKRWVP